MVSQWHFRIFILSNNYFRYFKYKYLETAHCYVWALMFWYRQYEYQVSFMLCRIAELAELAELVLYFSVLCHAKKATEVDVFNVSEPKTQNQFLMYSVTMK